MTANFSDTRPIDVSFHHNTHRQLLRKVSPSAAPQAWVDALIVPTSRPVAWLREATALAHKLGCGLVAMCSGEVTAAEAVALGAAEEVPVLAVDVGEDDYGLPDSSFSRLLDHTLFSHTSDLSKKRNLALLLARMAGWERVFLLDDDIYAIDPAHVWAAAGLLDGYDVVGMHNAGFPDNSVVCYVYRDLKAEQSQFIGAGALAVAPTKNRSFFLNTYNDDWFFMLGCGQPTKFAVTGVMRQKECDPFANPDRSRREELGDCLAEGLYWLLDHRLPLENADLDHWRDFLSRREYFIDELIDRVSRLDGDRMKRRRMLTSLQIARATRELISPGLCAEYVGRWRADLARWRRFIEQQPVGLGLNHAVEQLNWPGVVTSTLRWPSRDARRADVEDRLTFQSGWNAPDAGAELVGATDGLRDSSQQPSTLAGSGAVG